MSLMEDEMHYIGLLLVIGWLGVIGMPSFARAHTIRYEGSADPEAHLEVMSSVQDGIGHYAGTVDSHNDDSGLSENDQRGHISLARAALVPWQHRPHREGEAMKRLK
ncbi:hypothetical protein [Bombella saccharophila]|uniref:Uncharacterized protein n=1 Tax=Bombella saccharophila TaxID=2967338 RepID=A0ABT3WCM3_9PROT|nr:hypothetical protein [Bombella saccharophila]MCT6836940.1 hypothetical protein [Bifidobacteriales bacterium]MCX5615328.1 hypothetical protein [Bombella saccharophila]